MTNPKNGQEQGAPGGTPSDRRQVLSLLAKEWDLKGPPGILDVSDIVAALPLAPSDTFAALKRLFEEGLVDMNELKTVAFLTPEGYTAAGCVDGSVWMR